MTSLLITGGTTSSRLEAAQKKAVKVSAGPDLVVFEEALGIDEVRSIKAILSRRPYHSKAVTVIISRADQMSLDASNALLKTLEEPPAFAQIILLASKPELLLPTIRSRCINISLGQVEEAPSQADLKQAWKLYRTGTLTELFDSPLTASPGVWISMMRQLLLYQTGGKDLLTTIGGEEVLTNFVDGREMDQVTSSITPPQMQSFLQLTHLAREDLSNNVNQKLVMENLILALPRPDSQGHKNPS